MEIYDKAHAGKFAESLMSQRPRVWTASSLMHGENGYTFRVGETCRSASRLCIDKKMPATTRSWARFPRVEARHLILVA